jgi:hypothetical protein
MARLAIAAVLPLLSLVEGQGFPGATTGKGYIAVPVTRKATGSSGVLFRRGTDKTATLDIPNAQNGGYMLNGKLYSCNLGNLVVRNSGDSRS